MALHVDQTLQEILGAALIQIICLLHHQLLATVSLIGIAAIINIHVDKVAEIAILMTIAQVIWYVGMAIVDQMLQLGLIAVNLLQMAMMNVASATNAMKEKVIANPMTNAKTDLSAEPKTAVLPTQVTTTAAWLQLWTIAKPIHAMKVREIAMQMMIAKVDWSVALTTAVRIGPLVTIVV